jgi:MFS superfamily sulfate permease-like transporter
VVCTAGVAVFGAIPGILIAILLAIVEFLWDGWRPHWAVLGKPDAVDGYHDVTRYPDAKRIPGLVLFRWDAPLFFANAEWFSERVHDSINSSPTPVKRIVISAAPITSVDVTSADAIADLDKSLDDAGIELCFAELKDPVKDKIRRFGLFDEFRLFPTLESAVSAYLREQKISSAGQQP